MERENIWSAEEKKNREGKRGKYLEKETNIHGRVAKYMADTQTHRLYEGRARILN